MRGLLKIQLFLENIIKSLISILRIILRSKFHSRLNKIKELKEEIIVLANGPSFRQSLDKHPGFVNGKPKMVVNLFVLSPEYELLKPEYYVIVDIGFFMEKKIPRVKEAVDKMMIAFKEKTNWKITLLLPFEAKGSKFHSNLSESNNNIEYIFFNRTKILGMRFLRHYFYRRNLGMPPPQNVLIGAIMLAINLHYRKIYILGADHSWHESLKVVEGNIMEIEDSHFYDKNEDRRLRIQDPDSHEEYKIHEFFAILVKAFSSYWQIEEYAKSVNTKIYNASEKTYIDAFDRYSIESEI